MKRTPENITLLYLLALSVLASTPLFVYDVQVRLIGDPIFRVSAMLNFILVAAGFLLVQKFMAHRAHPTQPPTPGGVEHHPVITRPMLRSRFAHEPEMADVLSQYVAGLP